MVWGSMGRKRGLTAWRSQLRGRALPYNMCCKAEEGVGLHHMMHTAWCGWRRGGVLLASVQSKA